MRDQNQGGAVVAVERKQQIGNFVTGAAVEVAGRLIGKQNFRRVENARAIATRCCSPPESWAGICFRRFSSPSWISSCSAFSRS